MQFGAAAVWVLPNRQKEEDSPFIRESTISPFFLYTLKNQIITAVNINAFTPLGNFVDGSVRYTRFPDSYFGIGNGNDPDVSEQYTNVFFQTNGRYLIPLGTTTFLGLGWDLQTNRISSIKDGGMLSTDNPTGIDGGNVFSFGPAYQYDSRNNTIYPTGGYLISIRSLFNFIGDFNYTNYFIDIRKYITVWNDKNVFAFQAGGTFTSGDAPFYKLPQLGGDNRLRGIMNASLYRDQQMAYVQAEYRRPLFWRLGMTVFAGAGDVAGNLADFELSAFKYVAGVGGRFAAIPEDKINLRVDLGVARGGQVAIYVGISEAF